MKTEIIFLGDKSGSMSTIIQDSIGGFNSFLKDQQEDGTEDRMTAILFDNQYELIYQGAPISEARPFTDKTWVPRGSTAMWDAIGRTLNEQGKRIHDEGWADKVIVCITTDGMDNASKEYTPATVKTLIEQAGQKGWEFVFMAANQDAFSTGSSIGVGAASTMSYAANSVGTRSAYSTMSSTTKMFKGVFGAAAGVLPTSSPKDTNSTEIKQ